ncbi:AMP-binding protein, partial [Pauljensenia hongkongensis]|uniref:AMP-binding protein n=1 Tax=Pauljensenia hongkongensis TaxID=178339 RepID=UPI0001F66539
MTSITEQGRAFYDAVPHEVPDWEGSLFSLLEDAARLYPDRAALDYFGAAITYRQVLEQVERAASALVGAGVGRGDVVAVALPNCPQAFVVFYACMRIGAVAAQHNPLAPDPEVRGQLGRHKGRVAVVWEKCAHVYAEAGVATVFTVDISAHMPASQRLLLRLPVRRARESRGQLRGEA